MRVIEKIYISYKCTRCNKEVILITEEVMYTLRIGRYISCPHCGCKNIIKQKNTDDLREIMAERSYKRIKGALRQKGGGAV